MNIEREVNRRWGGVGGGRERSCQGHPEAIVRSAVNASTVHCVHTSVGDHNTHIVFTT